MNLRVSDPSEFGRNEQVRTCECGETWPEVSVLSPQLEGVYLVGTCDLYGIHIVNRGTLAVLGGIPRPRHQCSYRILVSRFAFERLKHLLIFGVSRLQLFRLMSTVSIRPYTRVHPPRSSKPLISKSVLSIYRHKWLTEIRSK